MVTRIDILEDASGDELIEDGDFAIGQADDFHVRDLLIDGPGDWRQYPEVGMLIAKYRNAPASKKKQFESELREALQNDGYKVTRVNIGMADWWKNFEVDAEAIK